MMTEAKPVVRLTNARAHTEGFPHLTGNAVGHERFADGTKVRTSRVVAVHLEDKIIETRNTRYAVDSDVFPNIVRALLAEAA